MRILLVVEDAIELTFAVTSFRAITMKVWLGAIGSIMSSPNRARLYPFQPYSQRSIPIFE